MSTWYHRLRNIATFNLHGEVYIRKHMENNGNWVGNRRYIFFLLGFFDKIGMEVIFL